MDGYLHDDLDGLGQHIRETMEGEVLPATVIGYDVVFGDHFDGGEPAVWVNLHSHGSDHVDWTEARQVGRYVTDLHMRLAPEVPGRVMLVPLTRPPASSMVAPRRAHA